MRLIEDKCTSALAILTFTLAVGCSAKPADPNPPRAGAMVDPIQYPARPTTPAPPFRLFHQKETTFTLVTKENATDEEITAIIYQLREAARAHTLAQLHLDAKAIEARQPTAWFHIYRGPKCAAEKYAPGQPPCGPSYHAAGDYTLGSYANPLWDNGTLLHNTNEKGDGPETPLWNPNTAH